MAKPGKQLIWAPAARRDLIEIWHYFAGAASPDTADKLLSEIASAAERLLTEPRMFQLRFDVMSGLAGGLRSVAVHPYAIFYRMQPNIGADDEDVQIIRVLHERRDFPSILSQEL